jgi:hypothetical protein
VVGWISPPPCNALPKTDSALAWLSNTFSALLVDPSVSSLERVATVPPQRLAVRFDGNPPPMFGIVSRDLWKGLLSLYTRPRRTGMQAAMMVTAVSAFPQTQRSTESTTFHYWCQ